MRRITLRLRHERRQPHKVVVARGFAHDESLHISLGNHAAVRVRDGLVEPLPHSRIEGLFLAHFPVRSPEQIARKALLGWLAHRLAMPGTAGAGLMSHWHGIFSGIAQGEIHIDGDLEKRAMALYVGGAGDEAPLPVAAEELVEDPLPCGYELRYTAPDAPSPMATLAAWADRLVTDIKSGSIAPRP